MADKTWPTTVTRAFAPKAFDEGLRHDVEITIARNGKLTTRSLPGARWLARMTFPQEDAAHITDRRQLEAFLTSMRGGADRLVMHNLRTPQPLGAFGGSPVLAASAAAGARTVQISGAAPRPSLIRYGGLDLDVGSGIATGWSAYATGATGTITRDTVSDGAGGRYQRLFATALGATVSDRVGVQLNPTAPVVPGQKYTLSLDYQSNVSGHVVAVYFRFNDSGGTYLGEGVTYVIIAGDLTWRRISASAIAPAGSVTAQVYVWMQQGAGDARSLFIDNVQFVAGTSITYAGPVKLLRGDRLQIGTGGRRVMVTADAVGNDAGDITVDFEGPLPAAVASGASVLWDCPTTRWVLASPLPLFGADGDKLSGFSIDLVEDPL